MWTAVVLAAFTGLVTAYQWGGDDVQPEQADAAPFAMSEPDVPGPGCRGTGQTDPGESGPGRPVARCAPGWPEPGTPVDETLQVAVTDGSGAAAPVTVAEERGEFAAEGLDVDVIAMPLHDAHAALARGDVDVVVGNLDAPFFDMVAAGGDARWVMGGTTARAADDLDVAQAGLWVHAGVIHGHDWSRIKGHTLALPGGVKSALVQPLEAALDQGLSSINAVDVRSLDGSAAVAALVVGEVSAAWIPAEAIERMRDDGDFELVATLPAGEPLDGTVMSAELLGPERDVGAAYVRAVTRTINTHFADESVVASEPSGALLPLYDWEIRTGTTDRLQHGYIEVGSVGYETPLPEAGLVDRSLVDEVIRGER